MPGCGDCVLKEGDLEEGGIWVDVDAGLVGRKKWVKRQWTVEMGGRQYAVGQSGPHRVIAYAVAGKEGTLQLIGRLVRLAVRYSLLSVVLAVWAISGFIFWIPLIVRATAAFCVSAVYSNLVSHEADVPNRALQHAGFFYVNGFRSIYRAVVEPHSGRPEATPTFRLGRFVAEGLWAVLFWWIALFTLAYLGIAFTLYEAQLGYPVTWFVEQASVVWAWLQQALDTLFTQVGEIRDAGLPELPSP